MLTLYGIRNCDTMRKAAAWLEQHGLEYRLHDYRRDGLDAEQLDAWERQLGWAEMINRRGTTWRKLDPARRESLDREAALALMLENPSIIRRPLLDDGRQLRLGFSADEYGRALL